VKLIASKVTIIFLLVSLATFNIARGQNFVPNGDFESYSTCPTGYDQLTYADGWISPTGNSPDYFNSCASSTSGVSTPYNDFGNQAPHSGEGYAGIYTISSASYSECEYIQDTLNGYLVAGQIYFFEMFVSLSENSCTATNIGVFFSDSAVKQSGKTILNCRPQISTSFNVTGKAGWTRINSCYVANGGEHYMTIGNFQEPSSANTTTVGTTASGTCFTGWTGLSYYYIDDVILVNRSHSLRKDTDFCGGTVSMDLNTSYPNATSYLWNTNARTSSIHITSPNYYWLKIVDSAVCIFNTDSFHITNSQKPTVSLGPDTMLCLNSSLVLKPTHSPGVKYYWQNGNVDSSLNINRAGIYWLKVTTPTGCNSLDSVIVSLAASKSFLGNDIHFCDSNSYPIVVSAGSTKANSYLWSTNSTDSFINVSSAGSYWVKITKGSCTMLDTIKVLKDSLPVLNLGNDSSTCYGNYFTVSSPQADSYKWYRTNSVNPNSYFLYSTMQSIPVYTPGSFALILKKGNCYLYDTIKYDFEVKPKVNLGSDTILCKNSTITYKVTYPNAKYTWSNGSTDSIFVVNYAGTYWAEVDNKGCKNRDTVKISASALMPFSLGPDTALCQGQTLLLDATTQGANSYKWSTKAITPTINIITSGRYWAEAKEIKCIVRDTINVKINPYPIVNLGRDTTVCKNVFLTIDAKNPGAYYLWGNGLESETIIVNQTGSYFVKVTKDNCSSTDTINLVFQIPPSVYLGQDTIVCEGTKLTLNATYAGASYKWQDGSTSPKLVAVNSGKYLVTITRGVCKVSDSIMIYHELKPSLNLGPDSSYCFNQPVLLDASKTAADSYLWNNGSTSSKFYAKGAGYYWVKINKGACNYKDSITLTQKSMPADSLGNDFIACKETIITLDAKNTGSTYLWNNQSTNQTINVNAPRLFIVKVTNVEGCFAFDSIKIDTFISPYIKLGRDTFICNGDGYEIDAGTQFKSYLWQDGSTNNFIIAKTAGNYIVIAKDNNNCSASDTVQISVRQKPLLNISKQIKICEPDFFIRPPENFISYLWQDGTTSTSYHVVDYGTYILTVTDTSYCSNTDSIVVLSNCPGTVFVPNAFTPNEDGNNETFYPVTRNVKSLYMKIYNRWGMLVFETYDANKGWDGKYKGNYAQQDVYAYIIEYIGLDNNNYSKRGNVTLLK
jgi:gliding motility-associated-like protein